MNKISTFLLVCSLCFGLNTTTFAQKYGHLNLGNLLATLPATTIADKQLVAEQEKMATAFEAEVTAFKNKYAAAVEAMQKGALTPVQVKQKEEELAKEQETLAKKEQENIQKIQLKRQELLSPILEKVEKAVEAVAKENGYVMIFDTSVMNTILFAEDSDDVLELVKKKLETM